MSASDRLRVFIATPLTPENCELLVELEPRIDLVVEQELLPPMRWVGDHDGDPAHTRTPEQQARFDRLCDQAEALYGIPDTDPAALARTVAANPGLRWVHTMAAGGGAQLRAAGLAEEDLQRIAFTRSSGPHARTLAEFALFGILAGAKDLPRLRAQQDARQWTGRWVMRAVFDLTVLILGTGAIGAETARLFSALGARVIGVNRSGHPVDGFDAVVPTDRIAEAAAQADALVNTLPQSDGTTGIVSAEVLDALGPDALLASTGRGTAIDEPALVAALADGRVGFAALDVFAVEPLPADSPLWGMANVLIAPHTAALHGNEDRLIAELFAENARRLLDGEELLNRIDTKTFV
ncbi:D-2-hydroxyacid dehydrogenase [Enemella evansiae]|uniref:D-2-hydroxyacid dehydrogenase n=1 Tax=Enemella evansiae TaxID=2016499 RepID=UPI0010CE94DD|nr:D-2-hydroxyacid dehydrogenase [Enemella evansiae]TDO93729.1 phosphoglycerate dehydrogenase-like enzyme [Enemella evansiae]